MRQDIFGETDENKLDNSHLYTGITSDKRHFISFKARGLLAKWMESIENGHPQDEVKKARTALLEKLLCKKSDRKVVGEYIKTLPQRPNTFVRSFLTEMSR